MWAIDIGVSHQTVYRPIEKVIGQSLVMVKRPLLAPVMKETPLFRCTTLSSSFELFFDTFGTLQT
uniref:Uncharacterized protein n=1 Tax=Lepeophtheirus salmonis TaxID=72036 RepID=A0A0K2TA44_LEPSM